MELRGIGTSSQDDAKDGYSLKRFEVWSGAFQAEELCAPSDFDCDSAADTIKTSQ